MLIWAVVGTYSPQMQKRVEATKSVFNDIEFMPGSSLEKIETSNKTNSVLVVGDFNVDAGYGQIKKYYIEELKNENWIFDNEYEQVGHGTNNYKELDFHKGKYILNINYFEDFSNYGCNYAISIKWKR